MASLVHPRSLTERRSRLALSAARALLGADTSPGSGSLLRAISPTQVSQTAACNGRHVLQAMLAYDVPPLEGGLRVRCCRSVKRARASIGVICRLDCGVHVTLAKISLKLFGSAQRKKTIRQ
jgi:hypothetical protein